ncbi:hypothetical protein AMTR_s00042p00216310 [Amborella trichopoda]|uniref:Uncharacterized protein n=1 Tax=Amborella trichopoda TaxID=13333 RepID=W1P7P1_AMBTC|nr:hypothetical protein AMTR_s00042p00216310 [Amborella trichopoda]
MDSHDPSLLQSIEVHPSPSVQKLARCTSCRPQSHTEVDEIKRQAGAAAHMQGQETPILEYHHIRNWGSCITQKLISEQPARVIDFESHECVRFFWWTERTVQIVLAMLLLDVTSMSISPLISS